MDVAASEFFKEGKYDLDFKNPNSDKSKWISSTELANLYQEFIKENPMVSIEDPFDQDDWEAWTAPHRCCQYSNSRVNNYKL